MKGPAWLQARWPLVVVVALSTVAVIGAFNPAPHSGGDNAGYVSLAYSLLADGSYTDVYDPLGLPHSKYPPVFAGLLAVLMFLGARSWVALKSVAALSTVVAVSVTYLWARRRTTDWAGFGVAVVLAFSSAVVYYSHWILSDLPFVAFTMIALWSLEHWEFDEGRSRGWLAVGALATGLAYFTRSAGLPLLVSVLAWFALRRRWRTLGVVGLALGIPALLWWARGTGADPGAYGSEFWLVDPYDPSLGRVGLVGLFARAWHNLLGYAGTHVPAGIMGRGAPGLPVLGWGLVILGVWGWASRARKGLGASELFFPMYAGLILLWPEVWSGDRFALPLFPLLFLYSWDAIARLVERWGRVGLGTAGAVTFLVVMVPSLLTWLGAARESSACGALTRSEGPFACSGPRFVSFVHAAEWSGANLPDGAAVLSRKPRTFFVMSGVPSRTFPFSEESGVLLAEAEAVGARYVLVDQLDNLALRYVGSAVRATPTAFCTIAGFAGPQGRGSQLLGIVPESGWAESEAAATADGVHLPPCDRTYVKSEVTEVDYSSSSRIPLLDRLDP
ncbi:MAG: glycosyltransferase family 39 protein [Gemmatimonadota bacterium]|nr:glycosyltransferase family 39 protein [Gemmatimonadota bacterium]